MTSARSILTAARAKIAAGWVQNNGRGPDGKVCAIVAIQDAVTSYGIDANVGCGCPTCNIHGEGTGAVHALMTAVNERFPIGGGWSSIPDWNDTPGRTQDEVLDTFDHAIKIAERDQGA